MLVVEQASGKSVACLVLLIELNLSGHANVVAGQVDRWKGGRWREMDLSILCGAPSSRPTHYDTLVHSATTLPCCSPYVPLISSSFMDKKKKSRLQIVLEILYIFTFCKSRLSENICGRVQFLNMSTQNWVNLNFLSVSCPVTQLDDCQFNL